MTKAMTKAITVDQPLWQVFQDETRQCQADITDLRQKMAALDAAFKRLAARNNELRRQNRVLMFLQTDKWKLSTD